MTKSKVIEPRGKRRIFLSFVEELWPGQIVKSMGRVEVDHPGDKYPSEEIRFGTDDPGWYKFREKWDFKYVTPEQLEFVRKEIGEKYMLRPCAKNRR